MHNFTHHFSLFISEMLPLLSPLSSILRGLGRGFIGALCVIGVLSGCSRPDASEVAGQVAKQYYEQLIQGDYAAFVDGMWQPDSLTADYREQFVGNMKKFVAEQNAQRKGIREIHVESAEADTARHTAQVYLLFRYGDNSEERVLVPMTEHGGTWYLR